MSQGQGDLWGLEPRLDSHFRPLCGLLPEAELTALNVEIVDHVEEIRKALRFNEFLDVGTAKESGAVLLIAKLDRLARNMHFVSGLMESGVSFTAVDMPQVDNLTIHILAAVAEQEAKLISERTKAALAAAKANGTKLGNPQLLTHEAQVAGAARNRETAVDAYRPITDYIRVLYDSGLGHEAIATRLNEEGHRTRRGKRFYAMTVYRILERVGL